MPSILERLLLLPSAVLALSVRHALAGVLLERDENSTVLPAPIQFAPDGNWDGIDGSWSSFTLGLGTPPQYVRTFISFASYQTLAVLAEGCQGASDQSACADTRGGTYNQSASSSFNRIGIYDWQIEQNLGVDGNSIYGYDTVELGGSDSNGASLQNTTVGGYAVADFYLGLFGVNPKPTNFTSYDDPSPSFMTLLRERNLTSSVSASYTAGARYRGIGAVASLTLGGYDSNKFVSNGVEFAFAGDNTRDIVVGVQSISTPSQNASNPTAVELLPGAIYAYIDSTFAEIWLPTAACSVFEYEFGLVYDNYTELYLVNDTLHDSLLQRNASITFSLAQSTSGGDTVQITLPYASFDLTASSPYQKLENSTRYFPLRRAANATQYTIGRTFLQEAYLTVNWEASRFNVSQVAWGQSAQPSLVAIPPTSGYATASPTPTSAPASTKNLGAGAIAGIVVGIVALLVLLGLVALWHFRRRSKAAKARAAEAEKLGEGRESPEEHETDFNARGREATVFPKAELEGSSPMPPTPMEESGDSKRLLSSHGSLGMGTIGAGTIASSSGFFPHRGSSAYSPSTPVEGEGTHSSNQSNSNGTNNTHRSSVISPLSPSGASEADSRERQVFEMAGDMPTIREKDGKLLSEKEAMQRRERIYNGVDSPPQSATMENEPRERRLVHPDEVAHVGTSSEESTLSIPQEARDYIRHRAFSFEEGRGEARRAGTGTGTATGRGTGTGTTGTNSSDELYS